MCFEDPEVSVEKPKKILIKSLDTWIGAYNISQFFNFSDFVDFCSFSLKGFSLVL